MALRPAKFLLYSRWWMQLGELDVLAAEHRQQINSEDELSLDLTQPLSKGDRILWTDGRDWHEHVVDDEDQEHDGGETFSARCVWSLQADLSLKHVRQWVAHDVSLPEIVSTLLDGTSWEPGTLESDVGSASFEFTRKSVYQCLLEACGAFGCELRSTLETGPGGVESRLVDLVPRVGADTALRFEYGVDLAGVTKRIEDEPVITACFGYGATLDTKTDGVQDRLWCYVTSESAKELWGLPDGKGGTMHAEGTFEDSECEDAEALAEETAAYLEQHSSPAVSYETDMPFASLKGARLGDTVQVVDREFTPEVRLEARIGELTRDVLTGDTSRATFGTVTSTVPDALARAYSVADLVLPTLNVTAQVDRVEQQVSTIDQMLKENALQIGGHVLSIVDGKIYLDGIEYRPSAEGGTS